MCVSACVCMFYVSVCVYFACTRASGLWAF